MKKCLSFAFVSTFVLLPVFASPADLPKVIKEKNEAGLAAELKQMPSTYVLANGKTPLMLAVEEDWFEGVDMLLKKKVNVNAEGRNGETALHVEVRFKKNAEILELLLKNGAKPDTWDNKDKTVLMYAIEEDWLQGVEMLLRSRCDPNMTDRNGETPLILALRIKKNAKIVDLLLKNGANAETRDHEDRPALLFAVEEGWVQGIETLLKNRCDPNTTNRNGETPLILEAKKGKNAQIVKLLVNNGANINIKDDAGRTAIMYAAINKDTAILDFLLDQYDTDASQIDKNGESALILAAKNNNVNAVTLLLEKARILYANQHTEHEMLPLIRAIESLDVNRRRAPDGKTAFTWAIINNNAAMVRAFIRSGIIDKDQTSSDVYSQYELPVLLWAIDDEKKDSIIEQLIDWYSDGAALNDIVDEKGRNAWYYATLRKNTQVQNLLRKKGIREE